MRKRHWWKAVLTLLLVVLLMVTLGGCGTAGKTKEDVQQEAAQNFDSTAKVTYGELKAELTLSREDGVCTVVLSEPELVKGMEFVFTNELLTVKYKGLSFDLDPSSLPAQAVASAMVTAVNAAIQPYGVEMSIEKTAVVLQGDSDAGKFLLRLDSDTGNYLSVDLPNAGFSAEFLNFSFT